LRPPSGSEHPESLDGDRRPGQRLEHAGPGLSDATYQLQQPDVERDERQRGAARHVRRGSKSYWRRLLLPGRRGLRLQSRFHPEWRLRQQRAEAARRAEHGRRRAAEHDDAPQRPDGCTGFGAGTFSVEVTAVRWEANGVPSCSGVSPTCYLRESAPSMCKTVTLGASGNVKVAVTADPGATDFNVYLAQNGSCTGLTY